MKPNSIRCSCNQRIVAKDVLQKSWYVRVFGPSYMYLKFRCGRCKRLGEKLIKQRNWDESILCAIDTEVTGRERQRFEDLGRISVDEQIGFRCGLDQPDTLAELARQYEKSN